MARDYCRYTSIPPIASASGRVQSCTGQEYSSPYHSSILSHRAFLDGGELTGSQRPQRSQPEVTARGHKWTPRRTERKRKKQHGQPCFCTGWARGTGGTCTICASVSCLSPARETHTHKNDTTTTTTRHDTTRFTCRQPRATVLLATIVCSCLS